MEEDDDFEKKNLVFLKQISLKCVSQNEIKKECFPRI